LYSKINVPWQKEVIREFDHRITTEAMTDEDETTNVIKTVDVVECLLLFEMPEDPA